MSVYCGGILEPPAGVETVSQMKDAPTWWEGQWGGGGTVLFSGL